MFSKYFNFCPDFFDHLGKKLEKKAKTNLKIYGIISWEGKKLEKKAKTNLKIYGIISWETNDCYANLICPISQEVKAIKL